MALFSGRIIEAHYIDLEYSVIEVLYEGDDKNVYAHALTVSEDNPEYQALLADGWDQERLLDGTAEYKRQSAADFNNQVNSAARELAKEMSGMNVMLNRKKELENQVLNLDNNIKQKLVQTNNEVFDFILNINEDKDELFKFKLWALELDKIKSASKEQKSEIRKCKNIIDGFYIIKNINNAVES